VINGARPTVTGLFQIPFSETIRREAGIPTMTVGNITSPDEINDIVETGRADLCVIGKGHLYDPNFVRHAARVIGADGPAWPPQYERGSVYKTVLLELRFENA